MNKKLSLEKSCISFSNVTLLINDEKTNITIPVKVDSEIIGGSPRTRAMQDAGITLIASRDEVIAPNSVISEVWVSLEIRKGAWFSCGNRPCLPQNDGH